MTTKMRRAEYKFPQAVPEEPQQDKRMPDQEQDSIVVAAKTVRISLSGQHKIAITTTSSTKVKPFWFLIKFFIGFHPFLYSIATIIYIII